MSPTRTSVAGYSMNTCEKQSPLGSKILQYAAILAILALTVVASFYYKGTQSLLLVYGILTALAARAILTNRHSYFVFFLFSFLTLGCWGKLILHLLFDTTFIEPTGSFNGSPESWDAALWVLIIAFATLLACNEACKRITAQAARPKTTISRTSLLLPTLYASMFATVAILAFNYKFAILKIGTTPLLQLNSYIYVIFSFMVAWGNFILLATLGYWLVKSGRLKPSILFYMISFEGALASVSMGSRAQMILHTAVPFVVYLIQGKHRLGWSMTTAQWGRVITVSLTLFVGSILLVSADRINSFTQARPVAPAPVVAQTEEPKTALIEKEPATEPRPEVLAPGIPAIATTDQVIDTTPESATNTAEKNNSQLPFEPTIENIPQPNTDLLAEQTVEPEPQPKPEPLPAPQPVAPSVTLQWKGMFYEMGKLIVDRWVGLEGVLTVISSDAKGTDLFLNALTEKPSAGTEAIYQRMASAQYQAFENFTFMTIPGPIAVLLYSDSFITLIGGLAFVFAVCFLLEFLAFRLLGNVITQAAIGVALAYLLVQTNFPRALFFMFIETLLFAGGLVVLRAFLTVNPKAPRSNVTC